MSFLNTVKCRVILKGRLFYMTISPRPMPLLNDLMEILHYFLPKVTFIKELFTDNKYIYN